jgi:drug/metabolite transporter (DMT)-like permease
MWFLIALLSAFFDASKNVLTKHKIHRFHSLTIAWTWMIADFLILVPLMFFVKWPVMTQELWTIIIMGGILDLICLILYIEGLRHCDLSLSLPMLALSPPVLLFSSYWFNGEMPNASALLGIVLVVIGIYFLNFKRGEHWFEPVMAIFRQPGTRLIALSALIWGVSGGLQKSGIILGGPFFYAGANTILVFSLLTPIVLLVSPQELSYKSAAIIARQYSILVDRQK